LKGEKKQRARKNKKRKESKENKKKQKREKTKHSIIPAAMRIRTLLQEPSLPSFFCTAVWRGKKNKEQGKTRKERKARKTKRNRKERKQNTASYLLLWGSCWTVVLGVGRGNFGEEQRRFWWCKGNKKRRRKYEKAHKWGEKTKDNTFKDEKKKKRRLKNCKRALLFLPLAQKVQAIYE
jgi:hypothetical protein